MTYPNATAKLKMRTENHVKFGRVVFEICSSTDTQTDGHAVSTTFRSNK